ncbi:Yersinia protein of uncharacterised function (DUF3831) [Yersinia enterocolitica]|nr:Yersinia protein of uncharacterised function (DUF3831) [Yersinia enterocolitica]
MTSHANSTLQGEDGQKSKASTPGMARREPSGTILRRLYDLSLLSVAGTLSMVFFATYRLWPMCYESSTLAQIVHNDFVVIGGFEIIKHVLHLAINTN